jgi:hypothetical protein
LIYSVQLARDESRALIAQERKARTGTVELVQVDLGEGQGLLLVRSAHHFLAIRIEEG